MRWVSTFALAAGLGAAALTVTASASPINFTYGYVLNAVTANGTSVTGTFAFNPGTRMFASNLWVFNLHSGPLTTSDLNNGVTFQNPDTHLGGILAYPDATVVLAGIGFTGPSGTYANGAAFEFDQGAGTGTLGRGSSSVESSLTLFIDSLPYAYLDPAGHLLQSSEFDQGPNLFTLGADFSDFLSGTVTLGANQNLPAPATTPEPASWALLGSGVLLLGGCALLADRRRTAA
ncbi:MAG: hypothetical protein ACRD1E_11675 [Terriglobales bacterium]